MVAYGEVAASRVHLPPLLSFGLGRYQSTSDRAVIRDGAGRRCGVTNFGCSSTERFTANPVTLIVHHHIFKNAGTTIDWILERNFPGQVLHMEGSDPGARLRPHKVRAAAALYPDHRAISSHSFPFPSPRDVWARVHLSVLRDPIERYASIYRFERSREIDHPANQAAREHGFAAFCQWWLDNPSGIWTNWQARCCTPQFAAPVNAEGLVVETSKPSTGGDGDPDQGGRSTSGLPGWDLDLDLALRAVLETGFVFPLDRFDEGLILLEERLRPEGVPFDASYIRQNVSRSELDQGDRFDALLGPDLHQALIQANAPDYELLDRVRAEVDRRYSALDPTGARLAQFRERCERLGASPNRPSVRIPGQADWILVPD